MKKITELDKFLQRYEADLTYSQFTLDFIEQLRGEVEEFSLEGDLSEADFLHASHYEVGNVVEIIRPDLSDCAFYQELEQLLSRLADEANAQARYENRVSKAGLN